MAVLLALVVEGVETGAESVAEGGGALTTGAGAATSCGTFSAFGYSPLSASLRSRPASVFETRAHITAAAIRAAASRKNRLFIVVETPLGGRMLRH